MKHTGSCHCGNIQITFESDIDPRQLKIRACQCSFCRKHGARSVSDPGGQLTIDVADQDQLIKYMFGHRTAEFLICRACGVYVAAVTAEPNKPRAILQAKILDEHHQFSEHAVPVDYADEDLVNRLHRRREVWMPTFIKTG